MIIEALVLATITGVGGYYLYRKLPKVIQRFLLRHPLLTDLTAAIITYSLLGQTILALLAAGFIGLVVSILLALLSNPKSAAAIEKIAEKLSALWTQFVNKTSVYFQKEPGLIT